MTEGNIYSLKVVCSGYTAAIGKVLPMLAESEESLRFANVDEPHNDLAVTIDLLHTGQLEVSVNGSTRVTDAKPLDMWRAYRSMNMHWSAKGALKSACETMFLYLRDNLPDQEAVEETIGELANAEFAAISHQQDLERMVDLSNQALAE